MVGRRTDITFSKGLSPARGPVSPSLPCLLVSFILILISESHRGLPHRSGISLRCQAISLKEQSAGLLAGEKLIDVPGLVQLQHYAVQAESSATARATPLVCTGAQGIRWATLPAASPAHSAKPIISSLRHLLFYTAHNCLKGKKGVQLVCWLKILKQ